jgi:lipoprotein-anchoring transpeptidase ErfK/SrfK
VTSRVTVVLALLALVAVAPLALSSAARLRAARTDAGEAPRAPLERATDVDARSSTAVDAALPGASQARAVARPRAAGRGFGVARLRRAAALRLRPGGRVVAQVGTATEFGSPQVLAIGRRRGRWLGVVSAALPNGRLGWLQRDERAVATARVRYSLHADLSARRLELRRGGRRVARLAVAVGRPGSETPTGRFAVTDKLEGARFGAYYGCCILALSGRQPNPPPGWRGGNRLAIHGTSAPASIGRASSAGCLRAADRGLRVLMRTVPLGTPLFVRP